MTTGIVAEVFVPEPRSFPPNWDRNRDSVARIERQLFGEAGWNARYLSQELRNPRNTVVLLKDGSTIIGYTWASPIEDMWEEGELDRSADAGIVAYIADTAIAREYHGRHLVGIMMQVLEQALRERGYRFMERDTAVANGYADNVAKAYAGRITKQSEPHDSPWGLQVFFQIALYAEDAIQVVQS